MVAARMPKPRPVPPTASPAVDADQGEDVRSRTDARRARQVREEALVRLARDLVALSAARLQRLELDEALFDAVSDARAITSHSAKNRQVRAVRAALRDADWWTIRTRLDALVEHGVPFVEAGGRESEWVVRLVGEGNDALEELVREYPNVDRAHLRTLVRNVLKGDAQRRKKAELQLAQALRSVLRG